MTVSFCNCDRHLTLTWSTEMRSHFKTESQISLGLVLYIITLLWITLFERNNCQVLFKDTLALS